MKKGVLKWIMMTLLCSVDAACLHACLDKSDGEMSPLAEKFYVNLNQVNFRNNKIYIDLEEAVYTTPAIFADENGYYIETIGGHCSWYEWQCKNPYCGTCNMKGVDLSCRGCGKPRG